MACFSPLKAYRSVEVNPETGKRSLTFKATGAVVEGSMVTLPCGQCDGCRMDRAQQWAIRCMHEAKMNDRNCFVTLTYADEHVPQDYSVKMDHWQKFTKRVRKRLGRYRYFGNGEYGEEGLRPHYHALLFGLDFEDKKFWRTADGGEKVYRSALLSELWPFGHHEIGSVTYQSAGYVARYCLKKVNGDNADNHYYRVSPVDGEAYRVSSEFCTMSRRPGIGSAWFDKFASDAFPSDFLVVDGRKVKPPGFYLRKLAEGEALAPRAERRLVTQLSVKRERKWFAAQPAQRWNSTKERLAVRAEVQRERLKRLERTL